jgi:hypothetical protein
VTINLGPGVNEAMGGFAEFWIRTFTTRPTPDPTFLAGARSRAVDWLIPRIPAWISAADLTRLGLVGGVIAAAALVASGWRTGLVYVVPFAVALNWLGATLDAPLATRRMEIGDDLHLYEHEADLATLCLMILAYAFSPFCTVEAAALVLTCFLTFATYNYIRAATGHGRPMNLMGVGTTEFRLMLSLWPFGAMAMKLEPSASFNLAAEILATIAIAALVVKAVVDAQAIASEGN